ncbi:MAG: RimK family alpha-L-glutamate ligase [Lachnospiraceae bacterium]|nr:RimK family alpha-L-glutamate ligase [Lachnospiraceae bacterium]
MRGWLVVNGFLHTKKFDELSEFFIRASKKQGTHLVIRENSDLFVDLGKDEMEQKPDFVIFWDKDILLAHYLEQQGIRVYNSSRCIALCDDKRKTHLVLSQHNIPMPRTIFAPMTYAKTDFPHLNFLTYIETELSYPIVVKEAYGSFGEQVYLAENDDEMRKIIKKCDTTEIMFQEYIETSKGIDIRLQVVGNEVVGSMYRSSEADFRANITAGGSMKPYPPTKEEKELALRAARLVEADFAGVDLLFGKEGPMICEINSNAHFKNLFDCTGVNTAEKILKYICEDMKCSMPG